MEEPRLYLIRRDDGATMWLTRESPLAWGDRERAKRHHSKGEALRAVERIKVHSKLTIEPTPT